MHNVMAQLTEETTDLISEECPYIHMLGDKYDALNRVVKTIALRGKVACTTTHLVIREHKETPEQCECNNNKDEVAHGS